MEMGIIKKPVPSCATPQAPRFLKRMHILLLLTS